MVKCADASGVIEAKLQSSDKKNAVSLLIFH